MIEVFRLVGDDFSSLMITSHSDDPDLKTAHEILSVLDSFAGYQIAPPLFHELENKLKSRGFTTHKAVCRECKEQRIFLFIGKETLLPPTDIALHNFCLECDREQSRIRDLRVWQEENN